MSEDNTPGAEGTQEPTLEQLQAEVDKWKAFSRKNEDWAKSNVKAAEELEKIKASQLSDLEKVQQRLQATEKEAEKLRTDNLKLSVASESGVPAELLSGVSLEEISASAEAQLSFAQKYAEQYKRPANLDQGQNGKNPNESEDPNAWLRGLAGK
jgi:hypothetical protein